MEVIEARIESDVKCQLSLNAWLPIEVTDDGIISDPVMPQLEKA